MKTPFNRYLHIAFVLMGWFFLLYREEPGTALIYLGLALAFDPFDAEQAWKDRPFWQKAVLVAELIVVLISGILEWQSL